MHRIKFTVIVLSTALLLFGSMVIKSRAAAGDLDVSFGNGGTAIISDCVPIPSRVRVQPDGKIITAASDFYFDDSYISRHNANGIPDTAFGNNVCGVGVSYLNFPIFVKDLIAAPGGGYFATGHTYDALGERNFALYFFADDGTFAGEILVGQNSGSGEKIALQPDGKIVVGGNLGNSVLLIRYNSNLSPDTGFGTDGRVVAGFSGNVREVLIQTDGKIIAAGSFGIARYNSNGTPDNGFGTGGIVDTGVPDQPFQGTALQADGKIVFNSRADDSTSVIKRYNTDGMPDISFGANGVVSIPDPQIGQYRTGIAYTLAIQNNGKILTAGSRNGSFAISRYNSNGTLDTNFGTNGVTVTPIGSYNLYNSIYSLALQPDGKVIATGLITYNNTGSGMVRYQTQPDVSEPRRTKFDFDGDGKSDLSVFRPSDRVWYLNRSAQGFTAAQFGLSTDKIAPADFDGDGRTDISVYRDGTWYWLRSSDNSFNALQFGIASDIPLPADFTGDGRAELAVYRSGIWWMLDLPNNQTQVIQFGLSTDKPVAADYDGDGRVDQAVYRNGEWHLNRSSQGYAVINIGLATDIPVPSDYDGDGKTDQAVYRDGTWHILQSSQGYTAFPFGIASDIPAPADYDGDGKADLAVFRNGVWWIRQSTGGMSVQQFGLAGDHPIPAAFLP